MFARFILRLNHLLLHNILSSIVVVVQNSHQHFIIVFRVAFRVYIYILYIAKVLSSAKNSHTTTRQGEEEEEELEMVISKNEVGQQMINILTRR